MTVITLTPDVFLLIKFLAAMLLFTLHYVIFHPNILYIYLISAWASIYYISQLTDHHECALYCTTSRLLNIPVSIQPNLVGVRHRSRPKVFFVLSIHAVWISTCSLYMPPIFLASRLVPIIFAME